MKVSMLMVLLAVFASVECSNMFAGVKPIEYHFNLVHNGKIFSRRVENFYFTMPPGASNAGRRIQGIRAYDLTNSGATMSVVQGGIGSNFVNLRMTSDVGRNLNYDLYIYA